MGVDLAGDLARQAALGEQHTHYAATLNNLANLYQSTGAYDRAEPLYLEAMGIRKAALGEQHPDYAASLNSLAALYVSTGAYDRAEPLFLEAIGIRKAALGEQHPDYAASLNDLANLYQSTGAYDRAEPLFLEAMGITKAAFGEQHTHYAASLNDLAHLYQSTGAYDRAEPLFLEAMGIRKAALGEEHPDYAASLNSLAAMYVSTGAYDRAEPLFLEAIGIRKAALGEQHPDYAASLNDLANLYQSTGAYDRAEPLFLEAMGIRKAALGEQHPDYAASLNDLAHLYQSTGAYDRAEPLLLEAIVVIKASLGQAHPDYGKALILDATIKARQGQSKAAITSFVRANDIQLRAVMSVVSEKRRMQLLSSVTDLLSRLITFSAFLGDVGKCYEVASSRKGLLFDSQMVDCRVAADAGARALALKRARAAELALGEVASERGGLEKLMDDIEKLESQIGRTAPLVLRHPSIQEIVLWLQADSAALAEYFRYRHFESGESCYVVFLVLPLSAQSGLLASDDHVCVIPLGPADDINDKTDKFRKLAGRKPPRRKDQRDQLQVELQREGVQLRKTVLDPVLDKVLRSGCVKHLYVSPDDELARLPFAALPLSSDDELARQSFAALPLEAPSSSAERGYVLDLDITISYLGSTRDLARQHADDWRTAVDSSSRDRPQKTAVVIANPGFDIEQKLEELQPPRHSSSSSVSGGITREQLCRERFCDLQGADREGDRVAELLASRFAEVELLKGPAATRQAFLDVQAPYLLHVATHSFAVPFARVNLPDVGNLKSRLGGLKDPLLLSGLAFAGSKVWQNSTDCTHTLESGIATAMQIRNMNLIGTELVVVSAGCGDGLMGLGRAFTLAGSNSLVLTLWNIDDRTTYDLMESFYKGLLSQGRCLDRARALRDAQRSIRKQDRFSTPYYWGAFVVYGAIGPLAEPFVETSRPHSGTAGSADLALAFLSEGRTNTTSSGSLA